MAPQYYLPYVTLQPDYPQVYADVSQSLVELEKAWISAYCAGVPSGSRHGKLILSSSSAAPSSSTTTTTTIEGSRNRGGVEVELLRDEEAGLKVERVDDSLMDLVVSTPSGSRTKYEVGSGSSSDAQPAEGIELAPTRLRIARRTLGPDLVQGALGITALDVHENGQRFVVGGPDGQAFTASTTTEEGDEQGAQEKPMAIDGGLSIEEVAEQRMRLRQRQSQRSAKVHLKGHVGDVRSAKFLAGGQVILTTSSDMTVRLFDASTGACPRVFKGHRRAVVCSSIIDRGHRVLTGSLDGTVRLWDVSSEGAAIQTITADKFAGVNAMARDSHGSSESGTIFMGLTSGNVQVVRDDGQTQEIIHGTSSDAGAISALDMGGNHLITGASNGDTVLYDVRNLSSAVLSWKRNGACVTDVKLTNDDAVIVATDDGMPYRARLHGDLAVTDEYIGWEVDHVDKVNLDQKGRVWLAGAQGVIRLYH